MTDTEIGIHSHKLLELLENSELSAMEGILVLSSTASNLIQGMATTIVQEDEKEEFSQELFKFTKIVNDQMEDNNIDLTVAMLTYALLLREYSFLGVADEETILKQLRKVAEMNESK